MANDLLPAGIVPLTLDELDRSMHMAARAAGSQAALQIMIGQAAGLSIGQCLTDVHLITVGGVTRPTLSATAQLALARRAGVRTRWVEASDTAAELELTPPGDEPSRWRVTMEEAARAGWSTGKNAGTWQKNPGAMLRARAITRGIRAACPEVLGGMSLYDADELADARSVAEPVAQLAAAAVATSTMGAAQPAAVVEPDRLSADIDRLRRELTTRDVLGDVANIYGDPGTWSAHDVTSLGQWLQRGATPMGLAARAVQRDGRDADAVAHWGPVVGWSPETAVEILQWRTDGYPALTGGEE